MTVIHTRSTRLRDHLGFGAASPKHWHRHPLDELTFTAHRISTTNKLLVQMLEDNVGDELKPLLGRRGGK
jgi:hypothetical protein